MYSNRRFSKYDSDDDNDDNDEESNSNNDDQQTIDDSRGEEDIEITSYPLLSDQLGQVYLHEPVTLVRQKNMIIANSADRNLVSEDLFQFRISFNDSLEKSCKFHKTHIKNITKLTIEYIIFPKYSMWNIRYHGTNEININRPTTVYVIINEVKSSTEYSNDELQNIYQVFLEKRCFEHSILYLPLNENDTFQGPVNYLSNGFTISIKGIDDYNYSPISAIRDRFHLSKLYYYESTRILRLFPSEEVLRVFLDIGDIVTFHNIEIDTEILQEMATEIQNMFRTLIVSTFDTSKRKGFAVIARGVTGGENYIDVSVETKTFPSSTLTLSTIDSMAYYKFPLSSSSFPKNFILNKSSQYEIGFKIEHLVPTMNYDELKHVK